MKKQLTLTALLLATAMPAYALEDGVITIWTGTTATKQRLSRPSPPSPKTSASK